MRREVNSKGYVIVNGCPEHRRVWRAAYGEIPYGWVVHHINFKKDDNRLVNLVALPAWRHDELHAELRRGAQYTHAQLMSISQDLRKTFDLHNVRLRDAVAEVRAAVALLESTGIPTSAIGEELGKLLGTGPQKLQSAKKVGRKRNKKPLPSTPRKRHNDRYSSAPRRIKPITVDEWKAERQANGLSVYPTAEELYQETFGKGVLAKSS